MKDNIKETFTNLKPYDGKLLSDGGDGWICNECGEEWDGEAEVELPFTVCSECGAYEPEARIWRD